MGVPGRILEEISSRAHVDNHEFCTEHRGSKKHRGHALGGTRTPTRRATRPKRSLEQAANGGYLQKAKQSLPPKMMCRFDLIDSSLHQLTQVRTPLHAKCLIPPTSQCIKKISTCSFVVPESKPFFFLDLMNIYALTQFFYVSQHFFCFFLSFFTVCTKLATSRQLTIPPLCSLWPP